MQPTALPDHYWPALADSIARRPQEAGQHADTRILPRQAAHHHPHVVCWHGRLHRPDVHAHAATWHLNREVLRLQSSHKLGSSGVVRVDGQHDCCAGAGPAQAPGLLRVAGYHHAVLLRQLPS